VVEDGMTPLEREYHIQVKMQEILERSGIGEEYWPQVHDELRAKAIDELRKETPMNTSAVSPTAVPLDDDTALPVAASARPLRGLSLKTLDDLVRFADLISKSAFVPQALQGKPGDVVAAIAYGLELGLTPMAALQNIAVINGKPSVYGDMQLALVLNDPDCEYVEEREPDDVKELKEARCEAKRRGKKPIVRTFSMADAETAGLLDKGGPWKLYPHRMLQMRARSWCLRDAFPHTLKGLYSQEEAHDIAPIDVTPALPRATLPTPVTADVPPAIPQPSRPEPPNPPVAPPAAPRLTNAQVDAAITTELKRLVGGRQDEVSKQERRDICVEVWGQGVDSSIKVFGLPLSSKRNGLARLQAMKFHPTSISTATRSQDVTTGQPETLHEISADDAALPPDTPSMGNNGYVLPRDVEALKLYAETMQQQTIFHDILKACPGYPDAPLVTPSQYVNCLGAITWAMQHGETDVP